jgi:hypothetical protein
LFTHLFEVTDIAFELFQSDLRSPVGNRAEEVAKVGYVTTALCNQSHKEHMGEDGVGL